MAASARARTARIAVGAPVVATHDIRDWVAGITIPAGTAGQVVAVGADGAFGYANVAFQVPGTTQGLPLPLAPGRDQAAVLAVVAADGRPMCQETTWRGPRSVLQGDLVPCTSRARFLATDPSTPSAGSVLLCGTHANAGRWAGYPDIQWLDLPVGPSGAAPLGPSAADPEMGGWEPRS